MPVHNWQQQELWVRLDGLLPFRHRLIMVQCLQPPTDAIQKWHTWPAAHAIKTSPGGAVLKELGFSEHHQDSFSS